MQFNYAQCPSPIPSIPYCIRPLIQIVLYRGQAFTPLLAQIDSGADFTAIDRHVAKDLHIEWDKGEKIMLSGIDGKDQPGYFHDLEIDIPAIPGSKSKTKIVFTRLDDYACLLGQRGFFDLFTISFDGKNEKFSVDI